MIGALNRGGAEQVVINLCNHLNRDVFDVAVVSLSDDIPMAERLIQREKVPVYTCGRLPGIPPLRNFIKTAWNLRKVIIRFEPDIVHSHLYSFNAPLQWLGSLGLKCKHFVTIHSVGYHYSKHDHWPSKVFRLCEKLNVKLSNAYVISVSNSVRAVLSQISLFQSSKIKTIYNGINTQCFLYKESLVFKYGSTLDKDYKNLFVVHIARFYEVKGHRYLLQAWPKVVAEVPEARLLLVGDGPLKGEMQRLADALGAVESVRFMGLRDDVPAILACCSLGVFPSLFEGLPVAPIEMMSMGLPVVASDIGPLREVIGDEEAGILFPPKHPDELAKAIVCLLKDDALRERLGKAARQRACRLFSVERQVAEHERLYLNLLGLPHGR
ncbi:MAG: glycosyltransferase [Deltaproteobacteria bacterium]|nr:glycosyltransferase [Deltaproteobacteria bacterium]